MKGELECAIALGVVHVRRDHFALGLAGWVNRGMWAVFNSDQARVELTALWANSADFHIHAAGGCGDFFCFRYSDFYAGEATCFGADRGECGWDCGHGCVSCFFMLVRSFPNHEYSIVRTRFYVKGIFEIGLKLFYVLYF